MIAALKAELRKLFSVRSTYVLILLATAFVVLFAFYIEGYKLKGAALHDPNLVHDDVINTLTSLPLIFGAIVAILLMSQEYRYNTIMYTLTSSNSRSKVLIAKLLVVSGFALLFTLCIGVLSPLLSYAGIYVHGHTLAAQTVNYGDLLWRGLFYGWAFIMTSLLITTLVRNQIMAIVALFVIPTIEQLLTLVLKHNAHYLPYTALNQVMVHQGDNPLSYSHATIVFSCYLVITGIVSWLLFMRRDAN